jgi:transposase
MGGDRRSRLPEHRAAVLELVAQPDLTLQEIRGALAAERGVAVGLTSVWRFLKAQQITLKKRAYTPPSRACPGAGRGSPRHSRSAPRLYPAPAGA